MPLRSFALVASVTTALLVLSACSDSGTDEAKGDWGFAPTIERILVDARAAGASEAQIETLQEWLEIQDTPVSDVEAAFHRMSACLDAAGIGYFQNSLSGGQDYPEFRYGVYANTGAEVQVMNVCDTREFYFVSMAYQVSPGVTARRARQDAEHLPRAITCLEDHGIEVSEVSTLEDLNRWLAEEGLEDPWSCTAPPYTSADM